MEAPGRRSGAFKSCTCQRVDVEHRRHELAGGRLSDQSTRTTDFRVRTILIRSGSPLFRSPNDSMECPIHARSKPKFTKAYSFGLVTALFFISSWTAQFVFQMISEGNEAANTGSHSPGPISSAILSPPPSEQRIDQPNSTIARKKESRLRPKQPNQRSAPDRAAFAARWSPLSRRPPASSGHHAWPA